MNKKPEKPYINIGKLVKKFKKYYPDLTSSKLRFLELKGLVSPKRSQNKYRVYYKDDVEKIYFILKMQKDYFMPLDVIKKKLNSVDFKKISKDKNFFENLQLKLEKEHKPYETEETLTAGDLMKKYKLPQSLIKDLTDNSIIGLAEEDGQYTLCREDIEIAKILNKLSKFGIHVRHLKVLENFANRNSSFMQQIILPLIKSSDKKSHRKASKLLSQLAEDLCSVYMLLVRRENRKFLEKYK